MLSMSASEKNLNNCQNRLTFVLPSEFSIVFKWVWNGIVGSDTFQRSCGFMLFGILEIYASESNYLI